MPRTCKPGQGAFFTPRLFGHAQHRPPSCPSFQQPASFPFAPQPARPLRPDSVILLHPVSRARAILFRHAPLAAPWPQLYFHHFCKEVSGKTVWSRSGCFVDARFPCQKTI